MARSRSGDLARSRPGYQLPSAAGFIFHDSLPFQRRSAHIHTQAPAPPSIFFYLTTSFFMAALPVTNALNTVNAFLARYRPST